MIKKSADKLGLASFLEQLPATVFWKDCNSVYLGCSAQLVALAGVDSDEDIIGKTDYELPWADVAQALIENDKKVIESGESQVFPESIMSGEGVVDVSFTIKTPMRDESGNIVGVMGVANYVSGMGELLGAPIDKVTADKIFPLIESDFLQRLYHDLSGCTLQSNLTPVAYGKKVRDYIENIVSLLPIQVYWMDCKGVYRGVNQAVLDFLGLQGKHEIIGKTVEAFIENQPAETVKKIRQQNDHIIKTGESISDELVGLNAKSEEICCMVRKMPIKDAETGEVIGVLGVATDITERKRMERELEKEKIRIEKIYQAESKYLRDFYQSISGQKLAEDAPAEKTAKKIWHYIENLLYQVPATLFWMDSNGKYLGCNPVAANYSHINGHATPVGKTNSEIFPEEFAKQLDANNQLVFNSKEVHTFEESFADAKGKPLYFLSHKAPILDNETGEVLGMVGAALDITDRKNMEHELQRAKEQSEADSLAKSHFLSNMRHDIRTPLSCIVGSAKILKMQEKDEEKLEFIQGILDCSESMLSMVTGMLEYDTATAKERPVKMELARIKKLAKEVLLMLGMSAKHKGIDLQLNIADDVPQQILMDSYRMQRILLNLINNAIKFTEQGYVALNIAVSQQDMNNIALNIAVHDTGIGIPEDKYDRIFGKFVRLAVNKNNQDVGEGLGLSIVHQYVNELNGSIAVSSTPGEGSTFYLTVPCRVTATHKEDAL